MLRLIITIIALLGLALPAMAQQRGYDQHRRQFHGGGQNINPYQRGADIVGAGRVQPYSGGGVIYATPQYRQPSYQQPFYQQPSYGGGWNNGGWNGGHHRQRSNDAALASGLIVGIMGAIIANEANRPQVVYRERPRQTTAAPREVRPRDDGYQPITLNQLQQDFRCDWRERFHFTLYGTRQRVWSRQVCVSQRTGYIAAYLATDNRWYAGEPD